MKTLLSVNNYHYRRGGADAVYFDHAALFGEAGWENAFFAMRHPKNVESEFSRYFVDEIEFGRDYGIGARLAMAAKIIYSVEAKTRMSELLEQVRPDIAHIHSVYHHISPSVIPLLRKSGIPVALTAHDLKLLCPAYTMLTGGQVCEKCCNGAVWNAVRHKCIKGSFALSSLIALESGIHRASKIYKQNVDRIVAPSRFYYRKFEQYGWPTERLAYVPNFIRVDEFSPDFDAGDYFVFIGRLSYEKGVATLCKAAAAAGAKLVVVGDGPLRESLQRQAKQHADSIVFPGFQSGEALRNWIRNARALVLPSEWYENAPISILEAYACGKPVIGARIGGIPELIEEGNTGWLFDSGSVEQLSELLATITALPDQKVSEAGRAARARVERNHTPWRYLDAMLEVYDSMLRGGAVAAASEVGVARTNRSGKSA